MGPPASPPSRVYWPTYREMGNELSVVLSLLSSSSNPLQELRTWITSQDQKFESLDMQNDKAGSADVPADQYNTMEAFVDHTTLPAPPNEVDFDPPLETTFTPSDLTMFMLPVQAGYGTTMGFDSSPLEHKDTNFLDLSDHPSLVGFQFDPESSSVTKK